MKKIHMVDLQAQYHRLKDQIDSAIAGVVERSHFIQGPEVKIFEQHLSEYLGGTHVITCGNGTDALQIAMMALGLKSGDEVIVPAFTYVATAEVIALLGLTPVLVDVDQRTFNIDVDQVRQKISSRTRAIVPVHLFGQCANMHDLLEVAARHNLYIIEDAAQSLAAKYSLATPSDQKYAGTMGIIGTTSFFPTKTLGCLGDGGALFTSDEQLAKAMRMIANHGQSAKYRHERVGVNSRLDTLQAAVLDVKLKQIGDFTNRRQEAAGRYDEMLSGVKNVVIPFRDSRSTHVFHQYTLQVEDRDGLMAELKRHDIPAMIYYPLPLHFQPAYNDFGKGPGSFPVTEALTKSVISLPIHTELTSDQIEFVCETIRNYYRD